MANREDPDEMPHNASFHQCLHCLLRQNQSSEKKYISVWLLWLTCAPLIYIMDHPDLIISTFMGNSIGTKMVIIELPLKAPRKK